MFEDNESKEKKLSNVNTMLVVTGLITSLINLISAILNILHK